jgi:hypothetical protein
MALGAPGRFDRGGGEAVRVDDLRREALRQLRRQVRVVERAQGRVGVQVDESRAEHQPAAVYLLACLRGDRIFVTLRHKLDCAAADTDVPSNAGVSPG